MEGTVLIIGLGLIGGSLAKAIKKEHPSSRIIGFDVDQKNMILAESTGIIDSRSDNLQISAELADLIVISVPVVATKKVIQELSSFSLKPNVIITDTGSTKEKIMESARVFFETTVEFIGGHPMAGSHKSGVLASNELIFENAYYLLIAEQTSEKTKILLEWLKGTRSKFLFVTAKEHDEVTSVISHTPHIVAALLVHQAKDASSLYAHIEHLAAGGFKDTTRIASSNPTMWRDILLENSEIIIQHLTTWEQSLNKVKKMLFHSDAEGLYSFFDDAREYRDSIPQREKGAIPAFYDLYITVPDYPGVISEVTGYLAEEKISITNIRIIETREDVFGVLVVSFQNDKDRLQASRCINEQTNYDTYIA
ncbi:prephenate dehydrogenase [Bacillus coahuilensis p1.1.43]|uniref:Prephenate dehydrogenase n=1 Tax=Bacillus coahuilensis p1.1.43 TaxID=1150625 RepID=A0A147K8N8_9BACI|nr:prephenate dehydrogenase [Bacillus coahuilensis]KUP06569.1 prephenate dehydrogenase [Bacillus coahuilensis p1.1.43]